MSEDNVYHGDYVNEGKGYVCQHCGEIVKIGQFLEHYRKHRDGVRSERKKRYEDEHPSMMIVEWDTNSAMLTMADSTVEIFMEFPVYAKRPELVKVTRWHKVATNVTFDNLDKCLLRFMEANVGVGLDSFKLSINKKGNFSVEYSSFEEEVNE